MKKIVIVTIIIALLTCLLFVFASCNEQKVTYNVVFKYIKSPDEILSPNGDIEKTFEAGKPIGNKFKLWNKDASEYTFYTDKNMTTIWNMGTDELNSGLILYAYKG